MFTLYCGGRILLYLECKFSNTITSATCDCANILADKKSDATSTAPFAHHTHKHAPDEFEVYAMHTQHGTVEINNILPAAAISKVVAGFRADVFHPPLGVSII